MATISSPFDLDLQFRGFITGSIIKSKSQGNPELCRYFGGIPYALPPIGPFRFTRPRALPACYRYGTRANPGVHTGKCGVCPQARSSKLDDEDCLQLNIWIPKGTAPDGGEFAIVLQNVHANMLQAGQCIFTFVCHNLQLQVSQVLIDCRWRIPPIWRREWDRPSCTLI